MSHCRNRGHHGIGAEAKVVWGCGHSTALLFVLLRTPIQGEAQSISASIYEAKLRTVFNAVEALAEDTCGFATFGSKVAPADPSSTLGITHRILQENGPSRLLFPAGPLHHSKDHIPAMAIQMVHNSCLHFDSLAGGSHPSMPSPL